MLLLFFSLDVSERFSYVPPRRHHSVDTGKEPTQNLVQEPLYVVAGRLVNLDLCVSREAFFYSCGSCRDPARPRTRSGPLTLRLDRPKACCGVADVSGAFDKNGLVVEIIYTRAAIEALVAGEIEFGQMTGALMSSAKLQGADPGDDRRRARHARRSASSPARCQIDPKISGETNAGYFALDPHRTCAWLTYCRDMV